MEEEPHAMKISFTSSDGVPACIVLTAEGQAENAQIDSVFRPRVVRNGPIVINTNDEGCRQVAVRLDPSPA